VLEQTDYYGYMPLRKGAIDFDNFGKETKPQAKGLKSAHPEYNAGTEMFSPPKTNYNPKEMTNSMLSSVFDKPNTAPRKEPA